MVARPGMNTKNFETCGQVACDDGRTLAPLDAYWKRIVSWRECNAAEYAA